MFFTIQYTHTIQFNPMQCNRIELAHFDLLLLKSWPSKLCFGERKNRIRNINSLDEANSLFVSHKSHSSSNCYVYTNMQIVQFRVYSSQLGSLCLIDTIWLAESNNLAETRQISPT